MRDPGIVVMKFGGTSVADADAIARVIGIVQAARTRLLAPPVVVVSAMSGVTDRLIALVQAAERRDEAVVARGVADLTRRHRDALSGLLAHETASGVTADIDRHLDDLHALLSATGILRAVSPAAHDAVVSIGELLTSRIVAAALEGAGGCGLVGGRAARDRD